MRLDKVWEAFRRYLRDIFFPAILVFIIGLAAWDMQVGVYPTPLHHLQYMFDYHTGLVYHNPLEVELPASWLIPPISRMPTPFAIYTAHPIGWRPIAFWGVSSPLWWSIWVAVPLAYNAVKKSRPVCSQSPELILMAWFIVTYCAFLYLAHVAHRWVYLFYFLQVAIILAPTIPTVLEKSGYGLLLKILIIGQALWFMMWFPVKSDWLLELLGEAGLGDVPWIHA